MADRGAYNLLNWFVADSFDSIEVHYQVDALSDAPKHGVLPIKPRGCFDSDEELRVVGVVSCR